MPTPPARNTNPSPPAAWAKVNRPCGPSRYTRRPGRIADMSSVKSPSALMVNSLRHGSVAVEAIVNGCSSKTNGEPPNFSQAN